MRRVARAEGMMVGAAVASTAYRRPVVVAAPPIVPVATVVGPPPPQTVVVENYNPYPPQPVYQPPAYPTPGPGYAQPPMGYAQPPMGYAQPGYPPIAAASPMGPPPPTMIDGMHPMAPPPAGYVQPMAPPPPAAVVVAAPAAEVIAAATVKPVAPAAAAAAATIAAVETVAAVEAAEKRHFYLVNEATCSVLGVDKACLKPGTHAVIDRRRPDKSYHQIWYMDHDGIIRSKLNDFALESKGKDERVKLVPYVGDARQQWTLEGNRIINKVVRANCLGLRKLLRLKDDADVIQQAYEGKPYQHWRMEPIVL